MTATVHARMTEPWSPKGAPAPRLWAGRVEVITRGRPFNNRIRPNGFWSQEALERLDLLSKERSIRRVLLPSPRFTAEVIPAHCFEAVLDRGHYTIHIPSISDGLGDGATLEPGDAYYLPSGDCHTLTVCNLVTGDVVAAHVGRFNLFDPERLKNAIPSRRYESIMQASMESLRSAHKAAQEYERIPSFFEFDPKDVVVHIACGISGKHFAHTEDKHKKFNRKMANHLRTEYGEEAIVGDPEECRIDMPYIIARYFEMSGVPSKNISHDNVDTFSDVDPATGEHAYWSNTRGDKARNGVIVVRNE